jgi:peptidoglycan hydrolase-like protein with peptidoglycan-binding domain
MALLLLGVLPLAPGGAAHAAGNSEVAALQVALRAKGLYVGPVDGIAGPDTATGLIAFQRRKGLAVDGIVGPQTQRALGRLGRPQLGTRVLAAPAVGWDVAQLQFTLAWHGFPSGRLDGRFGPRTEAALGRFQRWAGLVVDGRAGPATLAALAAPPAVSPLPLGWPVQAPLGDLFGPRGAGFHSGIDFPVPWRTAVAAAGAGRVTYAGWRAGGWGKLVTIAHGSGVRTLYAHLAHVDVRVGDRVEDGFQIGLAGSTGISTGPHLHFEVRIRGAAVDPLTALG